MDEFTRGWNEALSNVFVIIDKLAKKSKDPEIRNVLRDVHAEASFIVMKPPASAPAPTVAPPRLPKQKVGQTVKYQFTPEPNEAATVDLVAFISFEFHRGDVQELWWGWSEKEGRMCTVSVGYWWLPTK